MNLKKRPKSNISKDGKVYMPMKKASAKPLRKSSNKIFKNSKHTTKRRKAHIVVPRFPIYFFLICLLFVVGYFAIIFINNLRDSSKEQELTYVLGLERIPAYPGSSFIFQTTIEQNSVKNFLSRGNSAYRLPNNTYIDEVFTFYEEKLPPVGWQFSQMVEMESSDRKYGQYWVKDNMGLRIYSKFNDVWYETVTPTEAQTGLAERVKQETEMNLLLTDEKTQDLLPDFPWILPVPKEYIVSYKSSVYDSTLQQLTLSKIGEEERLNLVPIDKMGNRALDYALNDYVTQLNSAGEERWGVINTYLISTNFGTGIRGTISANTEDREISVIQNSSNQVVYVLDSNVMHNPFFDFVLDNIRPQDTKRF